MKITNREIIASIAIVAVMLVVGFIISDKITDYQNDKNSEYQKAVHISDTKLFQYGIETNVGNAFVYGDLNAVDTVTFAEIGGEYLYVEKIEKRYERHEEWETVKDDDGNERREKKVWYEWEIENRESQHSEQIEFCGIVFTYDKIPFSDADYIETVNGGREWSWKSGEHVKVKFEYYGVPIANAGTIYTRLADETISDGSRFYKDCTIEEALKKCTSGISHIVFWIFWILLICGCVYGFYYLDNKWLED